MGNCLAPSPLADLRKANVGIERRLSILHKQESQVLKILLLGTGSSGKSTLLKQFKILHSTGLGNKEQYKNMVSLNIISGLIRVGDFARSNKDEIKIEEKTYQYLDILKADRDKNDIWSTVKLDGEDIPCHEICMRMWKDKGIRSAAVNPYSTLETPLSYFMKRMSEIKEPDYVPSDSDILHLRQRTTGVQSLDISFKGTNVRIIDVGGQRNERKKWISHFENVTAILYVASLGDFDRVLLEDLSTNRMHESLKVFEFISSSPYFEQTNIILILNKKDLFLKRIRDEKADLRVCFPEYEGEIGDYREAVNYIRDKFLKIFDDGKAHMPPHQRPIIECYNTVGTDTRNVKHVFRSCRRIIVNEVLQELG